jgi:hypothetical protein
VTDSAIKDPQPSSVLSLFTINQRIQYPKVPFHRYPFTSTNLHGSNVDGIQRQKIQHNPLLPSKTSLTKRQHPCHAQILLASLSYPPVAALNPLKSTGFVTSNIYRPESTLSSLSCTSTRQRQIRCFTTSKNNDNSDQTTTGGNDKNKTEETVAKDREGSDGRNQEQPHHHHQIPIQEFMDHTVSSVRPLVDSTIQRAKDTLNTGDLLSVYSIVFLIFLILTAPYVARYVNRCMGYDKHSDASQTKSNFPLLLFLLLFSFGRPFQ